MRLPVRSHQKREEERNAASSLQGFARGFTLFLLGVLSASVLVWKGSLVRSLFFLEASPLFVYFSSPLFFLLTRVFESSYSPFGFDSPPFCLFVVVVVVSPPTARTDLWPFFFSFTAVGSIVLRLPWLFPFFFVLRRLCFPLLHPPFLFCYQVAFFDHVYWLLLRVFVPVFLSHLFSWLFSSFSAFFFWSTATLYTHTHSTCLLPSSACTPTIKRSKSDSTFFLLSLHALKYAAQSLTVR